MNFAIKSLLVFSIGISSFFHPVHVSITNMDYYYDQDKISLSIKVFKDDLNLLFVHLYQINADFEDEENIKKYQNEIDTYISNHFKITNDTSYQLLHKKIELDEETLLFFYDIHLDKKLDSIEIMNTIFLDLYFDQKNMLICNFDNREKGYLFNLKQTRHTISFNDFE